MVLVAGVEVPLFGLILADAGIVNLGAGMVWVPLSALAPLALPVVRLAFGELDGKKGFDSAGATAGGMSKSAVTVPAIIRTRRRTACWGGAITVNTMLIASLVRHGRMCRQ